MTYQAKLVGGPRTITNAVTEEHISGVFPVYFKRTITVRGNVVEFTR